MNRWTKQSIAVVLILALAILVGVGLWKTSGGSGPEFVAVVREPEGVMGTSCRLVAVVRRGEEAEATEGLRRAQAELSRVEALMSNWIERSEISQLNSAAADEHVPLSSETLTVLQTARQATHDTDGAFDVTCRPLIELWRETATSGRLPSQGAIRSARDASGWSHFQLGDHGAEKTLAPARVDLGGIAKGYAIDRAVEAMQASGTVGGMVDVGGDIRCFGRPPTGETWTVQIRDPFKRGVLGEFQFDEGAVCTSGNYARFFEIGNRRFSHICDPRTGQPADSAASVTVVAPDAVTADIWTTALSVLGKDGFANLPDGAEALLIIGDADDHQTARTDAFPTPVPQKR
jgi:thiamine biosynthesis lipoprotein